MGLWKISRGLWSDQINGIYNNFYFRNFVRQVNRFCHKKICNQNKNETTFQMSCIFDLNKCCNFTFITKLDPIFKKVFSVFKRDHVKSGHYFNYSAKALSNHAKRWSWMQTGKETLPFSPFQLQLPRFLWLLYQAT